MSITFNFKYKDSSLFENQQTAGFLAQVTNPNTPENGDRGTNGATLYITDFDLGNTYDKNLCLENIENGVLPNTRGGKLEGRSFVPGDLIMTQNREIYKLLDNDTKSGYKFDLMYMGTLKKKRKLGLSDYIDSIYFADFKKSLERCLVPVNRGLDSSLGDNVVVTSLTLAQQTQFPSDASIGRVYTQNYNSIDCSAGSPGYYEDWNKSYRYKVIAVSKSAASKRIVVASIQNVALDSSSFDGRNWQWDSSTQETKWYSVKLQLSNSPAPDSSRYEYNTLPTDVTFVDAQTRNIKYIITGKEQTQSGGTTVSFATVQTNNPDSLFSANTEQNLLNIDDQTRYFTYLSSGSNKHVTRISDSSGLLHIPVLYDDYLSRNWNPTLPTESSYSDAYRGMYGIKFKPIIKFKDSIEESEFDKNNYTFYLRIYLQNTKYFQDNCYSLDPGISNNFDPTSLLRYTRERYPVSKVNDSCFNFYKCIEIPLVPEDSSNAYYPTYISDYVADKFHPSGNNISVNFEPHTYGGKMKYVYPKDSSTYKYWSRIMFHPGDSSDSNGTYHIDYKTDSSAYIFQIPNFYDLLYRQYSSNHSMIQYYKNLVSDYTLTRISSIPGKYEFEPTYGYSININYRGGDSAFFSGMALTTAPMGMIGLSSGNLNTTEYSTYENYVSSIKMANGRIPVNSLDSSSAIRMEYATKEFVATEITKFLFYPEMANGKNKYEIVCINKETNEETIINNANIISPSLTN